MKLQLAFIISVVLLAKGSLIGETFDDSDDHGTRTHSKEKIDDSPDEVRRSEKNERELPGEEKMCQVSQFPAVENLNLEKLDSDWYEVFRSPTNVHFGHGLWRIQYADDTQEFLFNARFLNKKCMDPIYGKITKSPNSSFVMKYEGLKGPIEEEFRVIETDYKHSLVLYACHQLQPNGECHPDASILIILSTHMGMSQNVKDNFKSVAKKVCIDPSSLIQQDGERSCPMDTVDFHLGQPIENRPCQKTSPCTIACPTCCKEQPDGCIECNCHGEHHELKSTDGCETDLNNCPNPTKCHLSEKSPGCFVCDCPVKLRAPPQEHPEEPPVEIEDIRNCPTTCRTKKINEKLYCDCSNTRQCQPLPPNGRHPCTEKEERWYYDERSGTCHGFYGSCLDGTNNFRSLKDCISTCADICELPADSGSCENTPAIRYFFNRNSGKCDNFTYTGCGGNPNNFESNAICKHKCPEWMDKPESNPRPKKCYQPSLKGDCKKSQIRYFYLPVTRTCTSFFYSGCGGNENNFESASDCQQACIGMQTATQKACPEPKKCACPLQLDEDECYVCPCDGANGVQNSVICLAITTLFLWFAVRL